MGHFGLELNSKVNRKAAYQAEDRPDVLAGTEVAQETRSSALCNSGVQTETRSSSTRMQLSSPPKQRGELSTSKECKNRYCSKGGVSGATAKGPKQRGANSGPARAEPQVAHFGVGGKGAETGGGSHHGVHPRQAWGGTCAPLYLCSGQRRATAVGLPQVPNLLATVLARMLLS